MLRTEWGFEGFVISDSGAIENIVLYHKYSKTLAEAAAASVKAGCNIELTGHVRPSVSYFTLQQSLQQRLISEDEVRESIKKPLYIRMRQGEFDPPEMNPYTKIDASSVLSAAHREMATRAAAMSFVLMKNLNKVLPIKKRFDRLAVSALQYTH